MVQAEAQPGRGAPGGDPEVGRRAVHPHCVSGCLCVSLRVSFTLWVCVCLSPHGSLTPHPRLTAAERLRTKASVDSAGRGRGKGTSETPPSGSASPVPRWSLSPATGIGLAPLLPLRGWQQMLARVSPEDPGHHHIPKVAKASELHVANPPAAGGAG